MSNSWKPEVIADGSGQWCSNALRFATEREALENARDLSYRWIAVRDYRATESDDPPNHRWNNGQLESV